MDTTIAIKFDSFCNICKKRTMLLYFRDINYFITKCKKCGLEKLVYKHKSFVKTDSYKKLNIELLKTSIRNIRHIQHNEVINEIKKLKKTGSWLDIGCSFGWFLKEIKKAGYETEGVEPSPKAYNEAKKIKNIKIYNDSFPTKKIKKKFDVISLMDVLEHNLRPNQLIKALSNSLKKSGVLIIKVPNSNALMYRYIKFVYRLTLSKLNEPLRRIWQSDFDCPHYYYYNRKNLTRLFDNHNFSVIKYFEFSEYDTKQLNKRIEFSQKKMLLKFAYNISMKILIFLSNITEIQDSSVFILKKRI